MFKQENLVSIITPSYNSEKFISKTINSILNQTYNNWELLITDDCSTDETLNIIRSFQENDNRIKLFKLAANKGAGVARNNSIEKAKGRFIAFLDSDDQWKPNKLEIQIDFMLSNSLALTYSGYDVINENGIYLKNIRPPKVVNFQKIISNNYIGCLTAVYDTKIIGKHYMPKIRRRQDWVLWINIIKIIRETKGIENSLAIYTDRKNSISDNKFLMLKYNWQVYSKYLRYNNVKSIILIFNFLIHYAIKKIK
jgi:teichuronic acid biosynthesis glycosyltransferase TuaG